MQTCTKQPEALMEHEQGLRTTRVPSIAHRPGQALSAIVAIGAVTAAVSARVPAPDGRSQSTAAIDSAGLVAYVDSFMAAFLGIRYPPRLLDTRELTMNPPPRQSGQQ